MRKRARVRSDGDTKSYALQVQQGVDGSVRFDKIELGGGRVKEKNHLIVFVRPKKARMLAEWILENVEEEE